MIEWYKSLSVMEVVYFWLGVVSTILLVVQIILMCFTAFGGDVDIDGDGDIDVDTDSGVTIFSVKSITAFFAVGSWAGLLTCSVLKGNLKWISILVALLAGAAAWAVVVVAIRAMLKLQCSGTVQPEKLVGERATVYVSVPAKRSGRGKITLNAQGRYMEMDAMTEGDRLPTDEPVVIVATEGECAIVKKPESATSDTETVSPQ